MLHAVLQAGGGHGEVDGALVVLAREQGVDQAAAEAVAAAHAVHDMDAVGGGEAGGAVAVEHTGPVVVRGRDAAPQGDGDLLEAEALRQLLGHADIALVADLAGVQVRIRGGDAEHVLGILLVGDAHIHIGHQLGHHAVGLVVGPQLLAVVQVAADGQAHVLGLLAGLQADGRQLAAQGRGDAGEMEPVGPGEDGLPVEIGSGGLSDGGPGPVIDDLGGALRGALFHKVQAQAVAAPDDGAGIHTIAAQLVDGGLADLVGGDLGDEGGIHTIVGQGHCYVGLAAGIGGLKFLCLDEAQVALGIQAHHDLAECNDPFHIDRLLF